jgi:hypothetical protein
MEASDNDFAGILASDYLRIYLSKPSISDHSIPAYLSINKCQRLQILKWIGEIVNCYRLSIDTLTTAVNLIDRYSKSRRLSIGRLQLLAGVCLFIAAKFNERYYPALSELVFLSDGLYKTEDFLRMQDEVLSAVGYRVTMNDARLLARLKVFGQSVAPDFCEAIDFVARASLLEPALTFAPADRLADAIIDTVVNTTGESEGFTEHSIKSQLLDVLEESAEVFDS